MNTLILIVLSFPLKAEPEAMQIPPIENTIESEPLKDGTDDSIEASILELSGKPYLESLDIESLEHNFIQRKDAGKYEDAHRYLEELIRRSDNIDYRYNEGVLWELEEQYILAEDRYKELIVESVDPAFILNLQFRLGVIVSDQGRHLEAITLFKTLMRDPEVTPKEIQILSLAQGAAEIYHGKTRRGVRRINKTLALEYSENQPWIESRAREALVFALIQKSEGYAFGSVKKTTRNFQKRSELVGVAEEQIVVMIDLEEPEYVLKSLLQLSGAYIQVANEMRMVPAPRKLDREQQIAFQDSLNDRADFIEEKGRGYCLKGLSYAELKGFESVVMNQLEDCQNTNAGE